MAITSSGERPDVPPRLVDLADPHLASYCPTCGSPVTNGKRPAAPSLASPRHDRPIGSRFTLVSVLPTATFVLLIVALFASGTPTQAPELSLLVDRAAGLTVVQAMTLMFMILVAAVLTAPFQLALVRALEGYWGGSLIGSVLAEGGLRLQRRRVARLKGRARQPGETAGSFGPGMQQPIGSRPTPRSTSCRRGWETHCGPLRNAPASGRPRHRCGVASGSIPIYLPDRRTHSPACVTNST